VSGGRGERRCVKGPHDHLLITCADVNDRQFRGVGEARRLLAGRLRRASSALGWRWPLLLTRKRMLRWVVVSGHGIEADARISDSRERYLYTRDLPLAPAIDLYLLACHVRLSVPSLPQYLNPVSRLLACDHLCPRCLKLQRVRLRSIHSRPVRFSGKDAVRVYGTRIPRCCTADPMTGAIASMST
jgi:hypothetical protein